ncbi:MAG: DUF2254 domain-containing protein [Xanthobacteraceae bacterium]
MRLWLVPMIYVGVSVLCGFSLPRLEQSFLGAYTLGLSVASAQAYLSAAASGMMALMGIVFAMAFVMVQFSAIAYSPRLVLWFARDPSLFHALGIFAATFIYALSTLAWVDRAGTGSVPLLSSLVVATLLVLSMLLFSRLVQRVTDLQITNVLQLIGDRGREVIRNTFQRKNGETKPEMHIGHEAISLVKSAPVTQTMLYSGAPRAIASLDVARLVRMAEQVDGVIAILCAVGDTVVEGTRLLQIHGGRGTLAQTELMRAIRLESQRTFEQDPKYPIRLLVDIAIKALSPAINDPTTAVQTIDQIEDLLRRLGRCHLDAGYGNDAKGQLRLLFPMPTWEDYLTLGFDEIRQFGVTSVQVMRRLRAALLGLMDSLTEAERANMVQRYVHHLDLVIERSPLDAQDRIIARQEDPQGLGLAREPTH